MATLTFAVGGREEIHDVTNNFGFGVYQNAP